MLFLLVRGWDLGKRLDSPCHVFGVTVPPTPPHTHTHTCTTVCHSPLDIWIGLYNVPLQGLHEILVIARGIKLRFDRLLIVALHWLAVTLRLLWQQSNQE